MACSGNRTRHFWHLTAVLVPHICNKQDTIGSAIKFARHGPFQGKKKAPTTDLKVSHEDEKNAFFEKVFLHIFSIFSKVEYFLFFPAKNLRRQSKIQIFKKSTFEALCTVCLPLLPRKFQDFPRYSNFRAVWEILLYNRIPRQID